MDKINVEMTIDETLRTIDAILSYCGPTNCSNPNDCGKVAVRMMKLILPYLTESNKEAIEESIQNVEGTLRQVN